MVTTGDTSGRVGAAGCGTAAVEAAGLGGVGVGGRSACRSAASCCCSKYLPLFLECVGPLCLLFVLLEAVVLGAVAARLRSLGVLRRMLAVACHFRVEAFEAWPVICLPANAGDDWRVAHAGSAAQDVVGGIEAEIIAEPKLVAAQPEMKIVAAGSADPFGETGADGGAAEAVGPCPRQGRSSSLRAPVPTPPIPTPKPACPKLPAPAPRPP